MNNPKFRKEFLTSAKTKNNDLDTETLYRQSTILNHLMRDHDINYHQALVWSSRSVREWLLQEEPNKLLPVELLSKITSIGTGLSENDAQDLAMKLLDHYQQRRAARRHQQQSFIKEEPTPPKAEPEQDIKDKPKP